MIKNSVFRVKSNVLNYVHSNREQLDRGAAKQTKEDKVKFSIQLLFINHPCMCLFCLFKIMGFLCMVSDWSGLIIRQAPCLPFLYTGNPKSISEEEGTLTYSLCSGMHFPSYLFHWNIIISLFSDVRQLNLRI